MSRDLTSLNADLPVWAAPMAGGPSTPAMVVAAAHAGALGFLAGGYKSRDALAVQIAEVTATGATFGVNLFAPNPIPIATSDYRTYAHTLQPEADRYGLTLPGEQPLNDDDDAWSDKLALLLESPVPLVSFTFGLPPADAVRALQDAGSLVAQTVTTPAEALAAAEIGVDALVVQAPAAGGHSATFTPDQPLADANRIDLPDPIDLPDLVRDIRHAVALPVIATGGIATPEDATAALRAGAEATMVGTVLLRARESGTSDAHKAALTDPAFTQTTLTHAFTGRPARGLRNRFIDTYEPVAPLGYPALHHLTTGLRKAAAAAGDTDLVHLWAGTGWRQARDESVADALTRLAAER